MMHQRTLVAGSVILLAAGALATGALWLQSAPPVAATAVASMATGEVMRGPLVDTKTVTGALGYGDLKALQPSLLSTSAMITWIAKIGATIERGEPIYRLDGRPAVLLYGAVPLHRTLRFDPDSTAPVWVELEEAGTAVKSAELVLELEAARLADAKARETDAASRLADALAGTPAMPEFVKLAGAVATAEARLPRIRELARAELAPTNDVATAEADLAEARAALDAAIRQSRRDHAAAGLDVMTARVAVAAAEVGLAEHRSTHDALTAQAVDDADITQLADNLEVLGYAGSLAEQVRRWQADAGLPATGIIDPSQVIFAEGPIHIADHTASVGETLLASSPDTGAILDYSSTEKLVAVSLGVGDQALAAVGRAVTVALPDDSAVKGMITEVGSVVNEGAIEVTIAIADQLALGALEVASVDVELVSDSRDDVLSVPVAALLALPEGGFAIEVVTGAITALVPVKTGLFAAGRVEVSGQGLAEGMRVGVPG